MGLKHFPLEDKGGNCRKNSSMHVDKQVNSLFSIDLTADATTSNASVNSTDSRQQEDDSSFSLISWNIDGLDLGNLKERARGICSYLAL